MRPSPGRLLILTAVLLTTVLLTGSCATAAPHPNAAVRSATASPAGATTMPRGVVTVPPLPDHVLLSVPAQNQLPSLPNGCEVTSLAMLLSAVGQNVDKLTLAQQQPIDPTPVTFRNASDGDLNDITRWGNPSVGFVGNVSGLGYGIYHGPLLRLLARYTPGRALDLTGVPEAALQRQLAAGMPVVAWVTVGFAPTSDWTVWQSPTGPVRATRNEHAVLIVGYDARHVYVNNPLTGERAVPIDRARFDATWAQLGQQAVSVAPGHAP